MQHPYYIGLSIPSPICESIKAAQAKLYSPKVSIKPLEPHITLLPPPAVESIPPETLVMQVKEVIMQHLPVTFTLTDVCPLDGKTIAIHVEGQALHLLQQQLVRLLPDNTESKLSRRPFHPHVTLSQAIRGSRLPKELLGQYRDALANDLPRTCTVPSLTLYRWVKPRTYAAEQL